MSRRPAVLGLLIATLLAGVGTAGAAVPVQRVNSWPGPPPKIGVLDCWSAREAHGDSAGPGWCLTDVWGGDFEISVGPHVVRNGDVVRAQVADPTTNYGHVWSWRLPIGHESYWVQQPGCQAPRTGSASCSWRVTYPEELLPEFERPTAAISMIGQHYDDEDWVLILPKGQFFLHGFVLRADGTPMAGARVDLTGTSARTITTTREDGHYGVVLARGTYRVGVAAPRMCAVQRTGCENPTDVRLVSDKQVDFAERSDTAVAGTVTDHRGRPLAGVRIEVASAAGARASAVTGADGGYRVKVGAGAYNVRAVPDRTDRERYEPAVASVQLATGTVRADFRMAPGDRLTLATGESRLIAGLWWTTATVTGRAHLGGSVLVEDARGNPVPGEAIQVDPPYWDVPPVAGSTPGMLVCDAGWARAFPGPGVPSAATGADGRFHFTAFLGSQLGNALMHARELAAPTSVFDVHRFGFLGKVVPADAEAHDQLQLMLGGGQAQGLPPLPGAGSSAADVQEAMMEWLLLARATLAPDAQSPTGDVAPIRGGDGAAAILLVAGGNPAPARAHLETGAGLPDGYETWVLPIRSTMLPGGISWHIDRKGLTSLPAWEAAHGGGRLGYAAQRTGESLAYLGMPYPPVVGDAARAGYDRCAPGAAPRTTRIKRYSPLRLKVTGPGAGLAFTVPARRGTPQTLVLPQGTFAVGLTGTGSGTALLVVESPGAAGDRTAVFELRARRGARGSLAIRAGRPAATLRFDGRTVRARGGLGIRVLGAPARLTAGRAATLRLRLRDEVSAPVAGAPVRATGAGVSAVARTDARGRVVLALGAPSAGRVRIRATAPQHLAGTLTLPVGRRAR